MSQSFIMHQLMHRCLEVLKRLEDARVQIVNQPSPHVILEALHAYFTAG